MAHQTGEIITVQCGHYANFIGSHWWNLQQSAFCFDPKVAPENNCVNHDVHFREGQTLLGDFTFTPRLIAFDIKESMGTLKKEGILYDLPNQPANIPWQNDLSVEKSEQRKKNEFLKDLAVEEGLEEPVDNENSENNKTNNDQDMEDKVLKMEIDESGDMKSRKRYNLDNQVSVWSDFLKVHYHPKTMCLIEGPATDDEDENAADSIILGQSIGKQVAVADEIEDKLHFFTEECDHLQAFQLFVDPYDRLAGISTKVLESIADDYGTKSVLTLGLTPTKYGKDSATAHQHRILSSLIWYTTVHEHTSLLVPLSCSTSPWTDPSNTVQVPYLDYKTDLNYHTSAVLAALWDTASLPLRSKMEPMHVRDLCSSLNYSSRKIASLVGSLPLPISQDKPLLDYLMNMDGLPWSSFSSIPSTTASNSAASLAKDPEIQQLVVRGVTDSLMKKKEAKDLPRMLSHCDTAGDLLSLYLKESMPRTRNKARSFNPPLNTTDPFPHIFSPEIDVNGLSQSSSRPENLGVQSIPALAGLQSNPSVGYQLRSLVTEAKKINLKRMTGFCDQSFEMDDFNECVEKLLTIMEDYSCKEEDEESDSDNDDA